MRLFEEEKEKVVWNFCEKDTTPMLEIRPAHHDMLRRCRCKRMERSYLRLKKKEVNG